MGIPNCKACSNYVDNEKQYYFNQNGQNNFIFKENESSNKIIYSTTMKNQEFSQVKSNFENMLKEHGEFIFNKTITEIIDNVNPLGNQIKIREDIEKQIPEDNFIAPPIKFHTGEIYQGSWNRNNQRDGFGININPEGNIYKGLWINDKVGRYGLFIDLMGNYYLGDLQDGKSEGNGEMVMKNKIKYIGPFSNDLPNGVGKMENYEENWIYNGEVVNGIREGKGVLEYNDGTKYTGYFKNDNFEGKGILELPDGKKFEGEFRDNKIYGKGKYTWSNGNIFEGEYEDFIMNGNGKDFWEESKCNDWVNDEY